MGKRSNFVRFDRDYYTTPVEGVIPLLPHIMGKIQRFAEPCAGNGALIDHIEGHDFFSLEKNKGKQRLTRGLSHESHSGPEVFIEKLLPPEVFHSKHVFFLGK